MHRKPSHESAHGERRATCTDSTCSPCAAGAARRCPCPMPGSALCARPTRRAWRRRRWQTSQTSGPKAFATIIGQRIEIAARGFTEAIPSTASFSQADLSSSLVTGRRTVLKNPRFNPAICHVRTQSRANNLNIRCFCNFIQMGIRATGPTPPSPWATGRSRPSPGPGRRDPGSP